MNENTYKFIEWNNENFKDKLNVNMTYSSLWFLLRHNADSMLSKRIQSRIEVYNKIEQEKIHKMFDSEINYLLKDKEGSYE